MFGITAENKSLLAKTLELADACVKYQVYAKIIPPGKNRVQKMFDHLKHIRDRA
jgi:hypothetical protein